MNEIFANTVPSKGQLCDTEFVTFTIREKAALRVLFVGNSITRHGCAAHIGWPRDCGMAASDIGKDYVHLVVKELEKKYGAVDFCIAQASEWERKYRMDADILSLYRRAVDFNADIVVIRIGENADKTQLDTEEFAEHFEYMVKFFAENAKKVIVTSLFWGYAPIDNAIKAVCNRNPDYAYVPIDHLGQNNDYKAIGKYAHAGVAIHPGDLGMQMIANAVLNAMGGS